MGIIIAHFAKWPITTLWDALRETNLINLIDQLIKILNMV
jgi:hypothetical protein